MEPGRGSVSGLERGFSLVRAMDRRSCEIEERAGGKGTDRDECFIRKNSKTVNSKHESSSTDTLEASKEKTHLLGHLRVGEGL